MPRLTVELLRRRAEHNEGCLSTLQEVALHQQDLEKIELLGDYCRQLEILYLCNNYIAKIEGLQHLKRLKYLNLAVNSITVVEGLQGCESLERLDLTLNFIADMTCVQRLRANIFLDSLHLTGNPCTRVAGYRAYVIHTLPQLRELDGEEVVRAERIVARQDEDVVIEVAEEEAMKTREAERIKAEMIERGIDPFPARFNDGGERVYGHTPEERLQMLREQQERDAEQKRQQAEPAPGSISALHKELSAKPVRLTAEEEFEKYGRFLMRNEGKVRFEVDQDGDDEVVITVEPGKFISTTLLNVQAEVNVVRVFIKDKLLQLPMDNELSPDGATVQRSATTGQLRITVPLAPSVRDARHARRNRFAHLSKGLDDIDEDTEPTGKAKRGAGNASSAHARTAPKSEAATPQADLRAALLFPGDRPAAEMANSSAAESETPAAKSLITEVASYSA